MYNLNYFSFKKYEKETLLTNDFGEFIFLKNSEFEKMMNNEINFLDEIYSSLLSQGFIYEDEENFLVEFEPKLRSNKNALFSNTQLHIFVLTNQCNLGCLYCQAKSSNKNKQMMSRDDALKFVDIALSVDNNNLDFEFQGGEPTLNFGVLKEIVEYTELNKGSKKIKYNLVSNLYSISEEQLNFLASNNINVSTSLDGDSVVHNYNRRSLKNDSFEKLQENVLKLKCLFEKKGIIHNIGAIQTTTKKSMEKPEKIIDSFIESGLESIFLRPLSPLGNSIEQWEQIGYTPEEFIKFYKKTLSYIIELNKKNIRFTENNTMLFLKRIFKNSELNYMELRSPCGAVIGQLAYNYDGNIYSCDEGRMLKEQGDEAFKVGDKNVSYNEVLESDVTKSLLVSSCLEAIPGCQNCVFSPYCGTCPVYNYVAQKNIFGKQPENYKCKINKGILEHIFDILRNSEEDANIIKSWL